MGIINKQDTNGSKSILGKGEFGYDDYAAGGDAGRVYIGDGTENIALAKKSEVDLAMTSETLTSIGISGNILTYTDENGVSTNIDLSLYLDDTNLSRLTGGTLDGATGIATFSRDDGTTFNLDMSALLDDTTVTVIDNLTTTTTDEALSAKQGKILKDITDNHNTRLLVLETVTEW